MSLFCIECSKLIKKQMIDDKCPYCGAPLVDIIKFSPGEENGKKEKKK